MKKGRFANGWYQLDGRWCIFGLVIWRGKRTAVLFVTNDPRKEVTGCPSYMVGADGKLYDVIGMDGSEIVYESTPTRYTVDDLVPVTSKPAMDGAEYDAYVDRTAAQLLAQVDIFNLA